MNLLIFDLDGTLIDSKLDLVHAVNATRGYMGMGELPEALISSYIGNGAPVLIRRALGPGVSDDDVAQALEFFLAYYKDHMLDYTTLYPGVRDTLGELLQDGHGLAVLTNKPVRISQAIIEGLGLTAYFFRVYGGNSFDEKKPHPVGIETIIRDAGKARSDTLMVGDSAVDIQTARNAGVRSCGVTYGFQPESLIECPPDFLISRMQELLGIVGAIPP